MRHDRPLFRALRESNTESLLMHFRPFPLAFLVLVLLCPVGHFAQTGSDPTPDRIHYGDVIDVDIVGSFEYDWRGSLTPEGFLDGLDMIGGQIFALCRTESELAEQVARNYSRILRDPRVVVRILDRSKRPEALITGAVGSPQRLSIRRPVRLNELIVLSGGITDTASGEIQIFRPENASCDAPDSEVRIEKAGAKSNGAQITSIKISDLLGGLDAANPVVRSGDIITVLEALPIYVIGGVNKPTQLSSRSEITVSRAVAMAGGVSRNGVPEEVTIFRRGENGPERITADLNRIESKAAEDTVLKPYDIVDVGRKGSEKRLFAPYIETGRRDGESRSRLPLKVID
jgi:protein involved in polysaccharide export with SLBB domain